MNRTRRTAFYGVISLLIVSALTVGGWLVVAREFSQPLRSVDMETNGLVQVEMSISPPAAQPGEKVNLEVRVTNLAGDVVQPELSAAIPTGLSFNMIELPSATSMNVVDNSLVWRPIIGSGETRTFNLPLTVEFGRTADDPISMFQAMFRTADWATTLDTEYWTGDPVTAQIIGGDNVSVGMPVQLQAAIDGSPPYQQFWALGNGDMLELSDPVVVYAEPGNYPVQLEVANPLGSSIVNKTVSVIPDPAAQFAISEEALRTDQAVQFTSESGGEAPLTYVWDFGDGKISTEPNPIHSYNAPGTYPVRLIVQNQYGMSEHTSEVVVGAPPVVNMILPGTAAVNQLIRAEAVYAPDTDILFAWDMGDGRVANGTIAEHRFTNEGDYQVTMTAVNDYGRTQISRMIRVTGESAELLLPVTVSVDAVETPADGATEVVQPVAPNLDFENFQPIDLSRESVPLDTSPLERLLWYINKSRLEYGLSPLTLVPEMSSAAQDHTNDMAINRFTSHTGSDGSRPAERLTETGYYGEYTGEATAWGFKYPSGAVQFWLNSPSHRPIILRADATEVGVGYTFDESAPSIHYWTAEFGTGASSAIEFVPADVPAGDVIEEPAFVPPTNTAVPVPTNTSAPTETPLPTSTPEPTSTPQPTDTPEIVVGGSSEDDSDTADTVIVDPLPTSTPELDLDIIETAEPTETPEPTAELTSTAEPTAELTSTAEPTATPEPTTTDEPTATAEPIATATDEPEPTARPDTPTPEPTATSTAVPRPATSTPKPTATDEPADPTPTLIPLTPTDAPTAVPTDTPEPIDTATAVPTATDVPQPATSTPIPTATSTAVPRPATSTPRPTVMLTPLATIEPESSERSAAQIDKLDKLWDGSLMTVPGDCYVLNTDWLCELSIVPIGGSGSFEIAIEQAAYEVDVAAGKTAVHVIAAEKCQPWAQTVTITDTGSGAQLTKMIIVDPMSGSVANKLGVLC